MEYIKTFESYLNEDDTHGKFIAHKDIKYKNGDGDLLVIKSGDSLITDYVKGLPKSVTVTSGETKDFQVPKDWVRGLINGKSIKKG